MLVISFHPEIAGEDRVHELFLRDVRARRGVILLHAPRRVGGQRRRPRAARAPDDGDRLSERGWEQARGVGERLRGEGIEAIVASPFRRAQETAQAIGEVLGGCRSRPTATCTRSASPTPTTRPRRTTASTARSAGCRDASARPRRARRGVVRRRRSARVRRVAGAARGARTERSLCVSHWGFLHLFLGASLFGDDVRARAPARAVSHLPRQHRHHDLRPARGVGDRRRRVLRLGAHHLERPGPPLRACAGR